jgi:hypothetical protein
VLDLKVAVAGYHRGRRRWEHGRGAVSRSAASMAW